MSYTFLPWVREGLGGEVADVGRGTNRAELSLHVVLNATTTSALDVRLLGPGDVLGFDRSLVVRTDPPNLAGEAEPNYFPFVEFDHPSFPWLFTPGGPDQHDRLRPWLCLVVVRQQEGVGIGPSSAGALPMLQIGRPAVPDHELPNLTEAWAWAHVQVIGKAAGQELVSVLDRQPARSIARLLCPRRMAARSRYHACVVPAFHAGVAAALGDTVDPAAPLSDAWEPGEEQVSLPVYYAWEFTTGEVGDFETLATKLRGRRPPSMLGRLMDISAPWSGFELPGASTVAAEGALRMPRPADEPPDPPPPWFSSAMRAQLEGSDAGFIRPPSYGALQAGSTSLPADGWLAELNLDPRHRAAAGLGVQVVQELQETLMEAAWTQAGDLEAANQFLNRSFLAGSIDRSIWDRRLQPLDFADLVEVAAPMRLRGGTLTARMRDHPLVPDATLDPAFRRLTRLRGPSARRARDDESPIARLLERAGGKAVIDAGDVLAQLDPAASLNELIDHRVAVPAATDGEGPPGVIAPIVRPPVFPAPMVDELRKLSPDHLLAGAERLEPDSVIRLEVNRPFVAAFMAGLNHEMSRELLWREYPTEPDATSFRVFWDRRGYLPADATVDELADIPPIAKWEIDGHLGDHVPFGTDRELVVVVRSEFLARYPRAVVYAVRAVQDAPRRRLADETDPANRSFPLFGGSLGPDIAFFGFGISAEEARGDGGDPGWFVVFQQQPTEPRFGLDASAEGWMQDPEVMPVPGTDERRPTLTTGRLAWGHLVDEAALPALSHAPITAARPVHWSFSDRRELRWDGGSADVAVISRQRPVRVAIHGSVLLRDEARR